MVVGGFGLDEIFGDFSGGGSAEFGGAAGFLALAASTGELARDGVHVADFSGEGEDVGFELLVVAMDEFEVLLGLRGFGPGAGKRVEVVQILVERSDVADHADDEFVSG